MNWNAEADQSAERLTVPCSGQLLDVSGPRFLHPKNWGSFWLDKTVGDCCSQRLGYRQQFPEWEMRLQQVSRNSNSYMGTTGGTYTKQGLEPR